MSFHIVKASVVEYVLKVMNFKLYILNMFNDNKRLNCSEYVA